MKRLVLLFAGLLIGLTTVSASEHKTSVKKHIVKKSKKYRNAQPIVFVERGVELLIFPDGSFDFNINKHNTRYRNSRNVLISRNRQGKITRIGNTYLNYNRYGKITQAGNISINYERGHRGYLKQVGGLNVNYSHSGKIIKTSGQVNKFDKRNYRHSDDRYTCNIKTSSMKRR